ncbi:MAG: helix-turn-helix domain-containing protein [Cyanobacteria bacterium J06629_18]
MSKFSEVNPLDLPSVPLIEKDRLPQLAAIYFVISENGKILYIGRSINLASRWNNHHRYSELKEIRNVRIAWLGCSDESLLPQIEEAMIKHFSPYLNRTSLNQSKPKTKFKRSKTKAKKPYADKLSQVVKQARGRNSLLTFSKLLGVSLVTIQKWEAGDTVPDIRNLAKIAHRAGYSIDELAIHLGIMSPSNPSDLTLILRHINNIPLSEVAIITQAAAARFVAAAEYLENQANAN